MADPDGDGPDVEPPDDGTGPVTAEKAEALIPKRIYVRGAR